MRHDPELDLRIVRCNQRSPGGRDERLTNASTFGGTHRDVLQVRVGRRQATGRSDRLVIRRVNAAGARIDLQRQLVGVGGLQLRQAAVIDDHARQRVVQREFGEHRFRGRRLSARCFAQHRQTELVVQNRLQLFRRFEIECFAGDRVRLLRQLRDAPRELVALQRQQLAVDVRAGALHPRQYADQRHFDVFEHRAQARFGDEFRPHRLVQPQRIVGVFGGVLGRAIDRYGIERSPASRLCRRRLRS